MDEGWAERTHRLSLGWGRTQPPPPQPRPRAPVSTRPSTARGVSSNKEVADRADPASSLAPDFAR